MNAIILAHGGVQAAVTRHRPNWEAAFDGLTFISPSDDPLPGSLPIGLSCRNGTGAIERILFAVALASRFEECAIMEYDCLVFGRGVDYEIADHDGNVVGRVILNGGMPSPYGDGLMLCSEIFPNEDPAELFAAPTYGHCPWIATGETWWKLLTAGADYQMGFPDRWLALAALRANVALRGMDGAYSRDRAFDAATARMARLAGAPAIHGVKTAEEFEEIMRPAGNFQAFQKEMLQDLAAGLNVPKDVLYDESELGPSNIREWSKDTGTIETTDIETKVIYDPSDHPTPVERDMGQMMKDAADRVLGKLTTESFVEKMREEGA